ncbi:MAG: hypothetical protein AAGL10_03065 [Pseudomonadota bacterium]
MIATWTCPLADSAVSEELLVTIGDGSNASLLIIPPLFAEHNLMRRQLLLIMRALESFDIATHLPDLPGWNESTQPLHEQSLACWRSMMEEVARQVEASHVLAVRSGALLVPDKCEGWLYAPQSGVKLIRGMVRAQGISNREAGVDLSSEEMMENGRNQGITLAGWEIGAQLFRDLEGAEVNATLDISEITQEDAGSPGLWLRAEPDENTQQAIQIAEIIAQAIPDNGVGET